MYIFYSSILKLQTRPRRPTIPERFISFSGDGGTPRHPVRGHGVPRGSSRRYLSAVPVRDRYHCRYYARSVLVGDVGALGDDQGGGGRRTGLDGDDDVDHRRRAMACG